jgi:sortase A
LTIDRLGLRVIVVKGTDTGSLKKGPGLDGRTALPGEGELVYIAGHRTTYGAPFGDIDRLRPGDAVRLDLPYGRFDYVVTGHKIVKANDLSVLRSPGREVLALQACHPRFFASERYIVYARPRGLVSDRARAAAESA